MHVIASPLRGVAHQGDRGPAVDLVHLARQTQGDHDLEGELLALFSRQAKSIVQSLASSERCEARPGAGDLLHTLVGSATAVGCWRVAQEARALEHVVRAAPQQGSSALEAGRLKTLGDLVEETCAEIDALLEDR